MSCENLTLWADVCDPDKQYELSPLRARQSILSLGESWGDSLGGLSAVNTALCLSLSKLPGLAVTCTVVGLDEQQGRHAGGWGVTLLDLAADSAAGTSEGKKGACRELSLHPERFLDKLSEHVPWTTHVVGHSPLTHRLAHLARSRLYPSAKLILFYHVIPEQQTWIKDQLPYEIPTSEELIELAAEADVIYSVGQPVFEHFTSVFRTKLDIEPDHRLFLPQPSPELFHGVGEEKRGVGILLMCRTDVGGDWEGVDIALSAINQLCAEYMKNGDESNMPSLTVLDVSSGSTHDEVEVDRISDRLRLSRLSSHVKLSVRGREDILCELGKNSLCIIPTRGEPLGSTGLQPLCAGIPTLLPSPSLLLSLVQPLMPDPRPFVVRTTPDVSGAELDASLWYKRILQLMREGKLEDLRIRACALRKELRMDDVIKNTLDDVIAYCAGGSDLMFQLDHFEYSAKGCGAKGREQNEWRTRACFNKLLFEIIKFSWRVGRHGLIEAEPLPDKLANYSLPVHEIIAQVIDDIEDMDRRIVKADNESLALTVYCPTRFSLQDLWARASSLAAKLQGVLLIDDSYLILCRHRLSLASLRVHTPGPPFLKYNVVLDELDASQYNRAGPHAQQAFSILPDDCGCD